MNVNINQLEQQLGIHSPSPEQPFRPDWPGRDTCSLTVKRDDLLHPIISGNKWRKLKFTLPEILTATARQVVSFGGGFSNHLHALGYCCYRLAVPFTAIIRGDYRQSPTPTITDLLNWGARIEYVDRLTYRRRHDKDYLDQLQQRFANATIIPEGGSQQQALTGVGDIIRELQTDYDVIMAPVASGATLAGLIHATANSNIRILGIGVLKGQDYLRQLVQGFLPEDQGLSLRWEVLDGFHHGGYAKSNPELLSFCQHTTAASGIAIEPVYSGKLFFALKQLLAEGYFTKGTRILLLHTGGLQGARISRES